MKLIPIINLTNLDNKLYIQLGCNMDRYLSGKMSIKLYRKIVLLILRDEVINQMEIKLERLRR